MHSLYRIMVTASSVIGVMKMGNIVSRAGIEPTSLAFWASMLLIITRRLPDTITIPMPMGLCSSLLQRSVQSKSPTKYFNRYLPTLNHIGRKAVVVSRLVPLTTQCSTGYSPVPSHVSPASDRPVIVCHTGNQRRNRRFEK